MGNLTYKGLELILSKSKRKLIAIFTKRGQKEKYNKLTELVKSGNEKKFIEFLNSLDDDLKNSLIEILKEVDKKAVELNINIKEINSSVENIGRDKKLINNYGRYAEGDYFKNVNGDVVKGVEHMGGKVKRHRILLKEGRFKNTDKGHKRLRKACIALILKNV